MFIASRKFDASPREIAGESVTANIGSGVGVISARVCEAGVGNLVGQRVPMGTSQVSTEGDLHGGIADNDSDEPVRRLR